ncbi:hypothetical protein T05_5763 [Trichinella murrelli]|uniref:Uncharacterized protein n=1 Tax=Trichinella murrelli TaxID=144512 RepID=A0A0V0TWA5_9BILA|nr:hypothetical protein T05_5763 [Trichinella murrelli]
MKRYQKEKKLKYFGFKEIRLAKCFFSAKPSIAFLKHKYHLMLSKYKSSMVSLLCLFLTVGFHFAMYSQSSAVCSFTVCRDFHFNCNSSRSSVSIEQTKCLSFEVVTVPFDCNASLAFECFLKRENFRPPTASVSSHSDL